MISSTRHRGPAAGPTATGPAGTLARGSALTFAGVLCSNALKFVLVWIVARELGKHSAGVFFEALAAATLLTSVAALGLDVTIVRFVAVHRARGEYADARRSVRIAILVAFVAGSLAAAAMAVSAPLAARAFGAPALEYVWAVMAAAIPMTVLQAVLIGATRGTGRLRAYVVVDQILDGAARAGAVAGALWLGYGLNGAAWGYVAASGVVVLAAGFAAAPLVIGASRRQAGAIRALFGFAVFQWGNVVATMGLIWADSLLLGLWRPPADVAVYSIATRIALLGVVFIYPIGVAAQPMIARLYAQGDHRELRRIYATATRWATLAGCPPLTFVAIFAAPVIGAIYGAQYRPGATALALLCVGQLATAATGPCGNLVIMAGRSRQVFVSGVAALVVNVALNVVLIPPYGMVGAGLAWSIALIVRNVYQLFQARSIVAVQPFRGWAFRAAIALAVFVATCLVLRSDVHGGLVRIGAAALVAGGLYVAVVILLDLVEVSPVALSRRA